MPFEAFNVGTCIKIFFKEYYSGLDGLINIYLKIPETIFKYLDLNKR